VNPFESVQILAAAGNAGGAAELAATA